MIVFRGIFNTLPAWEMNDYEKCFTRKHNSNLKFLILKIFQHLIPFNAGPLMGREDLKAFRYKGQKDGKPSFCVNVGKKKSDQIYLFFSLISSNYNGFTVSLFFEVQSNGEFKLDGVQISPHANSKGEMRPTDRRWDLVTFLS